MKHSLHVRSISYDISELPILETQLRFCLQAQ